MFSTILLKRAILMKSGISTLMRLPLLRVVLNSKVFVKSWYFGHPARRLCKEINAFHPREVLATEYCTRGEYQDISSEVSELLFHVNGDINNFHRVKFKDAEVMLNFLQKGLIVEYEKYGLKLLEWCSWFMPDMNTADRILFAHSVWGTLKTCGTVFSTEHYNALLKCYAANEHRISVQKFLADMEEVKPDKSTYEFLLECTCVLGDIDQATLVIQFMKKNNMPVGEATFNSLILGHARARDIKNSLFTLDTMLAANLVPSAKTYAALIQSYAEFGDIKQMKQIYNDATSKNMYLNDFQVMSICRTLATGAHHECIPKFLALLPENNKKFTSVVYYTISELVHLKCEEAALLLVLSLLFDVEFASSENPGAYFVHEMCKANAEPMSIIDICSQLEKYNVFPRALYKAAESSLQLARAELTPLIFQALMKKGATLRSHYFWPIFRQRAKLEGEAGVLTTLKDMQALGLTPDFHTLLDYVLPVISTNDPEATVQKLQVCGVSVRQCITPVAAVLILKGKLQSVLQLCNIYPTKMDFEKLLQPLVEAFVTKKQPEPIVRLLKMFLKTSSIDLAGLFLLELLTIKKTRYRNEDIVHLLQSFKQEGISISTFTADVLMQFFKNGEIMPMLQKKGILLLESLAQPTLHSSPAETSTVHIAHPRDMSLEELEDHLVELKGKDMNTRGTLRRLLQMHVQKRNVKRVLELKEELEDSGFIFSPGMKASLFEMYIQLRDQDSAEKCLNKIMQESPDFIVDEHKIIDYATLLVSEKQYKAAVAVLERRTVSGKISGGESVSRNCWLLLNAIAMQGEPEKVKHMLHLLKILGFCSVSNTLLGPVIRAYLQIGDTEGAVIEYQKCAAEFQKTPLQQELLIHLVKEVREKPSNRHLLDDALASCSSVHGEPSTLVSYAVALAEDGNGKELRNLIGEKGSYFDYAVLVNRGKRLAKEGKLVPLSILTDACANLPNFDTSLLYTIILRIHDTYGDYDGAIQLWTKMQEQNIQPSQEFLQSLASILRSHNKTVPFSL